MTSFFRLRLKLTAALFAAAVLPPVVGLAQVFDLSRLEAVPELSERVPESVAERGVLVGGSDNAYAPWEFLAGDDGQTPQGIDIDVGRAIAKTLGLEYESRTAAFPSILPALGSKYDIGLNAFSITNERMKVVNFVSYSDTQGLWVIRAGNPTGFDPADYCGAKVAIMSGTYYEKHLDLDNQACLDAGKSAIKKLPFSVQTEAITRVAAGGADATATGGGTAAYAVKQSGRRLENLEPVEPMGKRGLNGIAVAKDDMELTQLIADTLNHLIDEGVYPEIYEFWGVAHFLVDESVVNPDVSN
ncbi:polar amino acid transport system substrate-binding protein [Palleronia marisminoris]|uniref:Glutamine-binding periplasmic protein n=1 Tax=Palleronia marisminoris TaxID=315423 RepID=A0A1Y5TYM0_9RHOB|nr:transporter substrate-binding domain-containing protein [Palleronia marisminoris]SFH53570.1 polar amino acid transport system substrate-binding protein [Palleronia marisminoris]SLN71332.1 Glutamine-binding periplasmic protein precursor [Palleronia marisminoris]